MTIATTLELDPYDYRFHEDPYPFYQRLRTAAPLFHNQTQDFWVLTKYQDVAMVFRDASRFSNAMGVSLDKSAWGTAGAKMMSFLAMDAPDHLRLRKLVSRGFTPRRVRELSPYVIDLTEQYLTVAFDQGDEFDWIDSLAGLIPMDVISNLMGVPIADRAEIRRLADLVVHRELGLNDVPAAGVEAAFKLVDYYQELISARRKKPGQDMVSDLLAVSDEDGDRLSEDEILGFLFLMMVAGNETTTKLLGNALFHLAENPAQKKQVLASEGIDLVPNWTLETLRHDTSTQLLARWVTEDVSLYDQVIPKDAKLLIAVGSANHDEAVFTNPEQFDIHREKSQLDQILSFGVGTHFCLGANLAKLEANLILTEFAKRVADFEVVNHGVERVHSSNVRGFAKLPIKVKVK